MSKIVFCAFYVFLSEIRLEIVQAVCWRLCDVLRGLLQYLVAFKPIMQHSLLRFSQKPNKNRQNIIVCYQNIQLYLHKTLTNMQVCLIKRKMGGGYLLFFGFSAVGGRYEKRQKA